MFKNPEFSSHLVLHANLDNGKSTEDLALNHLYRYNLEVCSAKFLCY